VKQILARLDVRDEKTSTLMSYYSAENAAALKALKIDPAKLAQRKLYHEALDQRLCEILAGV